MSDAVIDGAMCIPNITGAGRRRRRRFAVAMVVVGAVLFGALTLLHVGPWARALVGLPIAAAVASYLQVTRNTCVAHARSGMIEHEDFSTTAAPPDQSAASRRVASTILRDAAIAGALVATLSATSAFWLG